MRNESAFVNSTASLSHPSTTTDESSPRIIVFVAGARLRVEAAADMARKLYPGHHLVFVCEAAHYAWLSQRAGESIFVVEQPFNPFGRRASELRKSLGAAPIQACALVIADIGRESFRFRVFALRLRTRRFLLLGGPTPNDSKQLTRFSFAVLAGVTLLLRRPRKIRVNCQDIAPSGREPVTAAHDRVPQSATRDSGLIRMSNGWDDALGLILFINRLLVMVKPGARILDFGCGAGRMVFRLRELGFDAYGFDIHDYVTHRSDDDRQWFRFSQSTSPNTDAFTIDPDRYAIPFEDGFFDIVYSSSVIEHVLEFRSMMRECARVLTPDGIAIHFYPSKYQVVEPHLYVPLASFIQYKNWLRLWVALGARNEFQGQRTVSEVTDAYKEYTITGLRYRTGKELLNAAGEFFDSVRLMPRAVNPGDSVWAQIRQMIKALRTRDVYRQLGLCVRLSAMICEHKKVGEP